MLVPVKMKVRMIIGSDATLYMVLIARVIPNVMPFAFFDGSGISSMT
jgi:hypothetical protein